MPVTFKSHKTLEHKEGVGSTKVVSPLTGTKEEVTKYPVPSLLEGPTATVGVKLAHTKNLGKYESAKIEASLYLPCLPDPESIEQAYDTAMTWVDAKVAGIVAEFDKHIEQQKS